MSNPLLTISPLPAFSQIKPEHVPTALDTILRENRQQLHKLLQQQNFSWDNLVQPLEDLDNRLGNMWAVVSHLNNVMNTEEIRAVYNESLPKLTEYNLELAQHSDLYKAFEQIHQSKEYANLNQAQQKVIENAIRDYQLAGVHLPDLQKQRFKEIQQELVKLTTKFEENVIDATDAWSKHIVDANVLSGIPDHALAGFREAAIAKQLDGWLINLEYPSYYAVITYADNRDLRQEIYIAYCTRASDQSTAKQFDNSKVMAEILKLRYEEARLVGFNNYADYSLATKMAENTQQVLTFLHDLAKRSKPMAEIEWQELQKFAKEHVNLTLEAWDIPYVSEKLKQQKYHLSEEELRGYFPANQVLAGLFTITEKLFEINIKEKKDIDKWHEDVRYFEIYDNNKNLIAGFYVDLYARPKKRGGAWMDQCKNRHQTQIGKLQLPVAYLNCNFAKANKAQPALLTHEEVLTLFHEFGHGLQHMLTKIAITSVAGINGIAWDAVEFPSQFMEHFCWQKSVLSLFAYHYQSNVALPEDLYQSLINSRNFQCGLDMLRQLIFSIFDFRIHNEYQPERGESIQQTLNEVRQAIAVIPTPEFNRFQHSFSHIFAGGYAAGYYSYKWAEVLSCDAFSEFEKNGIFDKTTGQRFLKNILEPGGSQDAMKLFVAFMGREPKIDALLKYSGIE